MDLHFKISTTRLKNNEVAVFWLGQAGFLLKDSDDNVIVIDPYLSDCGERIRGFKRLSPKLISPDQLEADIFITTHIHFDHFDIDTIPIAAAYSKTQFFGPVTCVNKFLDMGIKRDRITFLETGSEVIYKDIKIKTVYADHGELAPDAIGIFMDIKGTKIYFSGDTAYRPDKMQDIISFKPDIAILSVNGKFGNLNSEEGAMVARDVGAQVAIPCHFWTFKEHGGDPQSFDEEMKRIAPMCLTKFMHQGEKFIFSK